MFYQCAPDPEDVLATRLLGDARRLCVFRLVPEPELHAQEEAAHVDVIAGEVIARVGYTRRTFVAVLPKPAGYALVITDDTGLPEKWRTLACRKTRPAIMKLFADFKEGDDDRRKCQAPTAEHRRATD